MPSALVYEREIIDRIAEEAKDGKISVNALWRIIMQEAHVMSEKTIKKVIRAFELMGYLKLRSDGLFDVDLVAIEKRLQKLRSKEA